jgi:hypothetical protein
MLRSNEQAHIGRLQRALEELHDPPVLELKIAAEGGLAHGAGGIDAGKEADLVVGFGGVPFAEAVDVNVTSVAEAFAGGDHGVFGGVFVVEAHVACGFVALDFGGFFLRGVVRVFWRGVGVGRYNVSEMST